VVRIINTVYFNRKKKKKKKKESIILLIIFHVYVFYINKYNKQILNTIVYGVVSLSPFFEKGQRAELYELMDDEMPTLRIHMPDENFEELMNYFESFKMMIEKFNNLNNESDSKLEIATYLAVIVTQIKMELKFYKLVNFNEVFPGYNFDEILPQLQIGEDGYAKFDVEEVFAGYDYDPEHYSEINVKNMEISTNMVYESNKNFDIVGIRYTINNLKMANSDEFYGKYNDVSLESSDIEQINKYVKIFNSEAFNESETDKNSTEDIEISDELETEIHNMENDENNFMNNYNFKTKNATMTFEING